VCGSRRLLLLCRVLLQGQPYQHRVLLQHRTPHMLLLQPSQLLLLVLRLSTRAATRPTTACGKQLQLRCAATPLVLLFLVLLLCQALHRPCQHRVLLQHPTPHTLPLQPSQQLLLVLRLSTRAATHPTTACGKQPQQMAHPSQVLWDTQQQQQLQPRQLAHLAQAWPHSRQLQLHQCHWSPGTTSSTSACGQHWLRSLGMGRLQWVLPHQALWCPLRWQQHSQQRWLLLHQPQALSAHQQAPGTPQASAAAAPAAASCTHSSRRCHRHSRCQGGSRPAPLLP
jgi:hypothetical protein